MGNMKTKALAPDSQVASANNTECRNLCKDTISLLPRQQKRILLHLAKSQEPQSVADIIRALGQTDPRGHISRLRKMGYPIADIRCKCENGTYKRYYIRKEGQDGRE
jgi:hypothetical protein